MIGFVFRRFHAVRACHLKDKDLPLIVSVYASYTVAKRVHNLKPILPYTMYIVCNVHTYMYMCICIHIPRRGEEENKN